MKLTCPGCSAQYTIAPERLYGRRVKVRCKRCGESFPVDSSQQSEEVYAHQVSATTETGAPSHATSLAGALTGERNETSVLFSLAALAKQAPAPPAPQTSTVTESSALIDLRALVSATSKGDAAAKRADDTVNLSGGGPFAPLFAPALPPPVTFVPAENERAARRGKGPIVIGAMTLAVVAMVGVAAFAGVRSRSSAPAVTAVTAATAVSAPADVPSVAGTAPSTDPAMAASEAPLASGTQLGAVAPVRMGTTSNVAPPSRSAAHSNDSRSVAAQAPAVSTPSTATKCCPGESEIACQMRISAGAACSAEPPASTVTSAAAFDRPAAARALGINVASCKRADGPTGAGHVKVTFQPSGSVSAVDVDAPYAGTATGACVAQRYRRAAVPPFAGGPLSVGKSFAIE
jgi:predicted Zn finger-like uncharacterized protein